MHEFLDQFLIESRELVEQATDDLLALEEAPSRERLDSAFRAFHTLKGAAGIMNFDAMGRALHAAEEVLSEARGGQRVVTPAVVSDCLICLDQVVQWLDAMQATTTVPVDAEASADAIVRRFLGEPAAAPPVAISDGAWADGLTARHPEAAGGPGVAIRITPPADCFFRGVDPLALVQELPGLRALELRPHTPWPPLEAFDPFKAQLVIEALLDDLSPHGLELLRSIGGDLAVVRRAAAGPEADRALWEAACELLRAQVAMLDAAGAGDGQAGKIGSAARVADNVLRAAGRPREAERLLQIGRTTPRASDLARALDQVLAGTLPVAASASEADRELFDHAAPDAVARSLRVDVDRVDALVSLTGELTVAKNAFGHVVERAAAGADARELAGLLKAQHGDLDRLVQELQRAVLHLRVLPMRHVFQRFPRLVREMVLALDKPARLVTEGDATEADKAVVENLFEPLLHVLRNALDHGIEDVHTRQAAGKPPSATIVLRARRDGDRVVIDVDDDGRGIDVQRVREIAAERGLQAPEVLAAMPDQEVTELIFAPGFSTADMVTEVSGRGVGMDAVRSSIERLGGHVAVESRAGLGTCIRFTLPFTLMMTRVMTVDVGGQVFGIPMDSILETVRLGVRDIRPLGPTRAFVLHDRTIPVIDLAEALGRPPEPASGEDVSIVVVTAAGAVGGFEVDRLGDRLDIMLKPLDGLLARMPGLAGATLLGDGRVLLVLDVQELLK